MPVISMEGSLPRVTRPNPNRLPDNHLIEWLAEAKQLYHHAWPPFIEKNQGSCKAGLRRTVTLRLTDDQQHALPVEAEMIFWSWSPQYTFCTIDVGGRRLIVKGNSSDRYCSYRSWLGPEKGFSYQPVAFGPWQKDPEDSVGPSIDWMTQQVFQAQTLSNPPRLGSSAKPDGRANQTSMKHQHTLQPEWRPSIFPATNPWSPSLTRSANPSPVYVACQGYAQEQQHYVRTENVIQAGSPSVQDSPRALQAKNHDVQVSRAALQHDSGHYDRTPIGKAPSPGAKPDASSPNGREEHSPNEPCEVEPVSPSQGLSKVCPGIQEDKGVSSKPNEDDAIGIRTQHHPTAEPTEPTDERVFGRPPYEKGADARTVHEMQSQGQDSTKSNSPSRPMKRRRQNSIPSPQLLPANHSPSTRSSPPPSTSSQQNSRVSTPTSFNPQSTHSSSFLASHKQSRTTLFIAIPLSHDMVPLKLRSCMTISSFFTSVLAICAQPGQEIVSGIRATFDWKHEKDVDKAILLKVDFPDTFEVFLEIIDGAPCWEEEGGRCGVGLEVVLA